MHRRRSAGASTTFPHLFERVVDRVRGKCRSRAREIWGRVGQGRAQGHADQLSWNSPPRGRADRHPSCAKLPTNDALPAPNNCPSPMALHPSAAACSTGVAGMALNGRPGREGMGPHVKTHQSRR